MVRNAFLSMLLIDTIRTNLLWIRGTIERVNILFVGE